MSEASQDQPDLEAGRVLFARQIDFVLGVTSLDALPAPDLPEVAFAGRSNVGKSSLINALTNRKTLARTSNTPGRTRELNYFNLDNRLHLVDLPGYGYARVSRSQVQAWTRLMSDYLRGRAVLRRVCLLIDARRGIGKSDVEVMSSLDEAAVSYQVVLTKADKLKPPALAKTLERVAQDLRKHVAAHPDILVTSSVKGQGLPELRAALATLAKS